jgi:hypothetical protein
MTNYMRNQHTRNVINIIKSMLGVRFYLVDLQDDALLYTGKYRDCIETIDAMYGGAFGVGTYREVKHIDGIDEQIVNLIAPEWNNDGKTRSHQYTERSFHRIDRAKPRRKAQSAETPLQHKNEAHQ